MHHARPARARPSRRLPPGRPVRCPTGTAEAWRSSQYEVRASEHAFDNAADIGVTKGSQSYAATAHLDRIKPWLRHAGIVAGQGGDPAVEQFATMHQQPPDRAIKDESDLGRHTPRRPVADHSSPADDLQASDVEPVRADQLQGGSHDRAAARLRMQAKANLGDPVAFQAQVDAAAEAALQSRAAPRSSNRAALRWPNLAAVSAKNSSASRS